MRLTAIALSLSLAVSLSAQQLQKNYEGARPQAGVSLFGAISLVDSGWTTSTSTSDCATGWGDDIWNLRLTTPRNLTVTVDDCCCPGDYYQVYVDDKLIGTTPVPSAWGCNQSGTVSSGSFTVSLCPGNHVIKVRDAGFDGHSQTEISQQSMCPAGFTVSGALAAPAPVSTQVEPQIASGVDPARAAQLDADINAVQPFIVMDKNGMERLRTADATRAGVSGRAIAMAVKLIALDNKVTAAAQRGEAADIGRAEFDFIEPLFLQQAAADPCGDRNNPAPCPPRTESGRFFSTQDDVNTYLTGLGYHVTSRYASRALFGRDFTRVVPHPCGGSSFRSQAITRKDGECWTYNVQEPEPNPEVLEYVWPKLIGWPGYVYWWHIHFC